jgi:hypothetical protein
MVMVAATAATFGRDTELRFFLLATERKSKILLSAGIVLDKIAEFLLCQP